MLTFLRKIRKSLIESLHSQKTSGSDRMPASPIGRPASPLGTYLFYAVGEILLVMIGILLALQVNNWNESRIQDIETSGYSRSLLTEVNENIEILKNRIKGYQFEVQNTSVYIRRINAADSYTFSKDSVILMTRDMGPVAIPTLAKSSFDDIINSGNLENFKNPDLRKLIMEMGRKFEILDNSMERSDRHWSELSNYYQDHSDVTETVRLMVSKDIPKTNFDIDRDAFINNRTFSNLLAQRLFRFERAERASQNLESTLIDLKSKLEAALL